MVEEELTTTGILIGLRKVKNIVTDEKNLMKNNLLSSEKYLNIQKETRKGKKLRMKAILRLTLQEDNDMKIHEAINDVAYKENLIRCEDFRDELVVLEGLLRNVDARIRGR